MQSWKFLKPLLSPSLISRPSSRKHLVPTFCLHFLSSQAHQSILTSTDPEEVIEDPDSASVFDSSHFSLPVGPTPKPAAHTWNQAYRAKVDRKLFGIDTATRQLEEDDEGKKMRANRLAKALLQAALAKPDDVEEEEGQMIVKEEDQRSLSVGIVGAPNAGKSSLTNFMESSQFGKSRRASFFLETLLPETCSVNSCLGTLFAKAEREKRGGDREKDRGLKYPTVTRELGV